MPTIRADVVDVYIFRRARTGVELLQLLRADDPLRGTWHPVMGHVNEGETAARTALRELAEEVGLHASDPALFGFWALEQTHPFYVARLDCVVISPRFAAEVSPDWTPRLNEEHSDARWIRAQDDFAFVWPGQRAAASEISSELLRPGSATAGLLRLDPLALP